MNKISSLNGNVQSQGIRIDCEGWLDMGSEAWAKTPDKIKAAAYQAAGLCGWTDNGIKNLMIESYSPRVGQFEVDLTLETLKDLAKQYPVEVEQVKERVKENLKFKINGEIIDV